MIRLVRMSSGKWYGKEIELTDSEARDIEDFVYCAEPVILCADLQEVDDLLDISDIQMVDDEE